MRIYTIKNDKCHPEKQQSFNQLAITLQVFDLLFGSDLHRSIKCCTQYANFHQTCLFKSRPSLQKTMSFLTGSFEKAPAAVKSADYQNQKCC